MSDKKTTFNNCVAYIRKVHCGKCRWYQRRFGSNFGMTVKNCWHPDNRTTEIEEDFEGKRVSEYVIKHAKEINKDNNCAGYKELKWYQYDRWN